MVLMNRLRDELGYYVGVGILAWPHMLVAAAIGYAVGRYL